MVFITQKIIFLNTVVFTYILSIKIKILEVTPELFVLLLYKKLSTERGTKVIPTIRRSLNLKGETILN